MKTRLPQRLALPAVVAAVTVTLRARPRAGQRCG
jgi:hypothetical protein